MQTPKPKRATHLSHLPKGFYEIRQDLETIRKEKMKKRSMSLQPFSLESPDVTSPMLRRRNTAANALQESLNNIDLKSSNALMEFLYLLGLEKYTQLFRDEEITLALLLQIDGDILSEIGIQSPDDQLWLSYALEQLAAINFINPSSY